MFSEGIRDIQARFQDETLFSEFGYLAARMKNISRKERAPAVGRTDEDVRRFLELEIQTADCIMKLKVPEISVYMSDT